MSDTPKQIQVTEGDKKLYEAIVTHWLNNTQNRDEAGALKQGMEIIASHRSAELTAALELVKELEGELAHKNGLLEFSNKSFVQINQACNEWRQRAETAESRVTVLEKELAAARESVRLADKMIQLIRDMTDDGESAIESYAVMLKYIASRQPSQQLTGTEERK